jgi:3-methyladenine DNA glycosylase AlkC
MTIFLIFKPFATYLTMHHLRPLLAELEKIEHGFKHIEEAGDQLLADSHLDHLELSKELLGEESYQARMLGTYLLGCIAAKNEEAFIVLKERVSRDENWRVQEMLAKAFDRFCKDRGYEKALPVIKEWLDSTNPNQVRAVIEGLRIWTGRPYFKQNPQVAIDLISRHKDHESEYVRKSVGNSLRDISRKFGELVKQETMKWDVIDKRIAKVLLMIKIG